MSEKDKLEIKIDATDWRDEVHRSELVITSEQDIIEPPNQEDT